jgi:hypothetical protein
MKSKEVGSFIIGLFLISALVRLIPHPPNMTPIGGIAILSGVYLRGYLRYLLPLIPMMITDILLGFSSITLWVYLSFMMITLFSSWMKKTSLVTLLGSSTIFFLLSNLGVYLLGGYPQTFQGLLLCYTMALPFFFNTIIGDLIWTKGFEDIGQGLYRKRLIPQGI